MLYWMDITVFIMDAQIAAPKKSAWAKLTAQFPNADKSQFFAQVYSDG